MEQFDLIVIGAGITGVAIAARARAAGMQVAVVEQHATVAQGASFAQSGMVLPSALDPWFGPGVRGQALGACLPWRRKALEEAQEQSRLGAFQALAALVDASRVALLELEKARGIDFEARQGGMYLFRTTDALNQAKALAAGLTASNVKHRIIDADACRLLEPALEQTEDLAGALVMDDLMSGNCALAAKRLKAELTAEGVDFMLARRAVALHVESHRVGVDIEIAATAAGAFSGVQAKGFITPTPTVATARGTHGSERVYARRVVIAAGSGSSELLAGIGVKLPLMKLATRSLSGPVMRDEFAPRRLLIDAERAVSIVRFEQHIRVSALIAGKASAAPAQKQILALSEHLHACADHRIPGGARLSSELDSGEQVIGIDAHPVFGAVAPRGQPLSSNPDSERVHLCLAGASRGWGLALGAAELLVAKWTAAGATADASEAARHAEPFSPQRFL